MIIIALAKDKKHLTKISLSDGSEILIDNDVCIENSLCAEMEVEAEFLKELKFQSDYKRAKSRALWYLDKMDYTEKALFDKLVRAGFNKKAIAAVMANLTEFGMIDDRRYAERYAERLIESNTSKREALNKMYLKGIPLDLAKEVLEGIDSDEEAQISELIERKYAYKLSDEKGSEKVFAALARKGFSFSAIRAVLKKYNDQLEFCEEE